MEAMFCKLSVTKYKKKKKTILTWFWAYGFDSVLRVGQSTCNSCYHMLTRTWHQGQQYIKDKIMNE